MLDALALLRAAASYVRNNPAEIVTAARNAAALRFGVPVAGLRWLAARAGKGKGPKEVAIDAVPPGLRVAATMDLMKTPIRASATIRVDEVRISDAELRFAVRIRDVKMDVMAESDSPIAALLKSGALDLSRPGDLAKFMPKRPPALVDADGDRVVLDLMKVPQLADNQKLRRALAMITPVLGIRAIETDGHHVYVALRAEPGRLPEAIAAARRAAGAY